MINTKIASNYVIVDKLTGNPEIVPLLNIVDNTASTNVNTILVPPNIREIGMPVYNTLYSERLLDL